MQLPGLRAQNRHIQHRRPRPGHRGGGGDGGLVQRRGWRPEVELKWIISHLSGTYGQVALAAAKHGHGQGVSTSWSPDVIMKTLYQRTPTPSLGRASVEQRGGGVTI